METKWDMYRAKVQALAFTLSSHLNEVSPLRQHSFPLLCFQAKILILVRACHGPRGDARDVSIFVYWLGFADGRVRIQVFSKVIPTHSYHLFVLWRVV